MKFTGTITKVSERDWGDKTLYSWQLDGKQIWFRTNDAGAKGILVSGQVIQFEGENPNKIDASTLTIVSKEDVEVMERSKPGPPLMRDDYWRWKQLHDLEREDEITYGSARADAARIVTCALDNDCLDIPKNLAKGKKYDLFLAIFSTVTQDLYKASKERTTNE